MGPNPHADEMLVVPLPSHGVLFQGDLFSFYGEMMRPEPGRTGIMPFQNVAHSAAARPLAHLRRARGGIRQDGSR